MDVYLVQLNVDINSLKLQESEVSAVKFIPFQELEQMFLNDEKTLVPQKKETYVPKLFSSIRKKFEQN